MASKALFTLAVLSWMCMLQAQPRHVHTIKAIPLSLINPLHQTLQLGYEYHYNQRNALHVELGYFHNELIFYELHHRDIQGIKVRAERRFYTGGGNARDLWNHHYYFAPHVMFQSGWVNYEDEFSRHGGSYFETMHVKGDLKQFGFGATYGSYFDCFGTFVVEGSIQVGVKSYSLRTTMPEDIPQDFFPPPWQNASLNTWYWRPMINATLALGLGWGAKFKKSPRE